MKICFAFTLGVVVGVLILLAAAGAEIEKNRAR